MWRWLRRLIVAIVAIVLIAVAIPAIGLAYGFLTSDPVVIERPEPPRGEALAISGRLAAEIEGYKRAEESTFLTYPEWSIVYAAREYAGSVGRELPSSFPYWAYVGRFWQDYALMIRATEAYPFNFQNHLMLMVIGVSHTVEHAVQWAYENTIGRLTELAASWQPTPEDGYQAAVAAEYAAFLDQVPWYRFPYAERRGGLWDVEPARGWTSIRSWERKLGFGIAYSIKQGYADLIKSGLDATSDAALLDIHVWAQGPVEIAIAGEADTRLVRDLGADGAVFVTQRYQVFTDMIPRLVEKGVRFVEIGGNRLIFLTVLSGGSLPLPDAAEPVLDYQLPASAEVRRTGIAVPVARLHEFLPFLEQNGAKLEHVYDY
ncbi:MAG: hypothetical protein JJ913_12375 [Rhizobiaceae bacterium]|nr:hypothetical protein [Rhizobiaceae bacterium]